MDLQCNGLIFQVAAVVDVIDFNVVLVAVDVVGTDVFVVIVVVEQYFFL